MKLFIFLAIFGFVAVFAQEGEDTAVDDFDDEDLDFDDEDLKREARGLRDILHKLEKNLRPVGKPILEDAAARAIQNALNKIGLGKRAVTSTEKRGLKKFFHKIEKHLRPVAKPILNAAAADAILKGLAVAGLGKRDVDQEIPTEKRGLHRFLHKIEKHLRPVAKPILEAAAANAIYGALGKRDVEYEIPTEKRGLHRFLHKIEKHLRPVAKPILNAAAADAILKGLAVAGLGKRDVDQE